MKHVQHVRNKWIVRVTIPEELRPIMGKRELVESDLPADARARERKAVGIINAFYAQIDEARERYELQQQVSKAKAAAVSSLGRDSIKFHNFEKRYGWTRAQYAEYVQLPPAEWKRLLDKERKRIKAAPRRTADLSQLSDIEKKLHRNAQNARNQEKSRARRALAKGAVLLTDEELVFIEVEATKAEAQPVQNADPELAQLLADLREAEAREIEADREHRTTPERSHSQGQNE